MLEHLHPKLVHFPIALVVAAMILDVVSYIVKKETLHLAARYVFYLAAFFSVLTVFSGLVEADKIHLNHPILSAHRSYAIALAASTCIFCVIFPFLPLRFKRPAFTFVVLVCVILVIMTGNYGGQMVYEYGIGVEH